MTEYAFLVGFVCWLIAWYGGGGHTMKREPYYTSTKITFKPRGGIETAPTRSPKPVPPVQPNKRKKKKARRR